MPRRYCRGWLVAAMLLAACGGRVNGPGAPSESSGGGHGAFGRNANRRGNVLGSAGGDSARGGSSSASSGSSGGASGSTADTDGGASSGGRTSQSAAGAGVDAGETTRTGSAGGAGVNAGAATGTGSGAARALGPPTEVWVGQVARQVTIQDTRGSDALTPEHVVLVLSTNQSGTSGSVVFGDREPPSAATDPSAFYPPLGSFDPLYYEGLIEVPFNGFPYTLLDLDIRDGRLTASIGPGELWHDWCALQPKSQPPSTYDGYVCGAVFKPQIDASQATDPPDMRVLCDGNHGRGGTYAKICNCDLVSCRANLEAYPWRLDLELKDGAYEGEFAATFGDVGGVWAPGVRLRRVQ